MKVHYTKELLEPIVKECLSYAEVLRRLGLSPEGSNPKTLKNKLDEFGIDYSHFTGRGWNKGLKFNPKPKRRLEDIMTEHSSFQSYKLIRRMLQEGLREPKCECCGRKTWNGKPIPLSLHHIDGDKTNNTSENIQILCPNCHAQTDNYCGKKNRSK